MNRAQVQQAIRGAHRLIDAGHDSLMQIIESTDDDRIRTDADSREIEGLCRQLAQVVKALGPIRDRLLSRTLGCDTCRHEPNADSKRDPCLSCIRKTYSRWEPQE